MRDASGNEVALSATGEQTLAEIRKAIKLEPVDSYEPCAENYMTKYMNRADVKTAIHVKDDIVWEDCSTTIRYKTGDRHHDMTPIYNYLIDGGFKLNILVFSGDDDDVCATIGTQDWIWDLGYQVAGKPWQAYTVDGQVGGYLTKWSNTKLAFATVHGAGHEVPAYKPEAAYWLWESYLKGELTNE
jgi:carboxypeptidase C (cathepsin A)